MARARIHRPSFGSGPRRLTQWVAPANQGFVNVASAGATLISSFAPDEGMTIVRSRGMVSVRATSLASTIDIVGAYGEAIVTNEAFAAGVGSIPEPFTDADWGGWLVWRSFSYSWLASSADIQTSEVFEVDSKAMRKIGPNDVLVGIAESQVGAYSISSPVRTLVKLS